MVAAYTKYCFMESFHVLVFDQQKLITSYSDHKQPTYTVRVGLRHLLCTIYHTKLIVTIIGLAFVIGSIEYRLINNNTAACVLCGGEAIKCYILVCMWA